MDTFIDLFETLYNISVFFYSAFKQRMIMNKQNTGCSHFLGHSVVYVPVSYTHLTLPTNREV